MPVFLHVETFGLASTVQLLTTAPAREGMVEVPFCVSLFPALFLPYLMESGC